MKTFKLDGRFQLWSYTASDGRLLLRSLPSAGGGMRVDVIFTDVAFVYLPTLIEDLEVREAEERIVPGAAPLTEGQRVFAVRGRGFDGYVVATAVLQVEGAAAQTSMATADVDIRWLLPEIPDEPSEPSAASEQATMTTSEVQVGWLEPEKDDK